MQVNIQNEIVNYLNSGARYDFFYKKNSNLQTVFQFIDSPEPAITKAVITLYYQLDGEVLKTWEVNQTASNEVTFNVLASEMVALKPLNYWVEAVDQDGDLLFYGSFTIL
jgi:hypothetical protein